MGKGSRVVELSNSHFWEVEFFGSEVIVEFAGNCTSNSKLGRPLRFQVLIICSGVEVTSGAISGCTKFDASMDLKGRSWNPPRKPIRQIAAKVSVAMRPRSGLILKLISG